MLFVFQVLIDDGLERGVYVKIFPPGAHNALELQIVPIINPDGVARGHYRADTQGLNLNRFYDAPDPKLHPTISAVKDAVRALSETGKLKYFVDLHAHATKRGCFCYANALPTFQEQIENMLYPRLVSINCPHFDFGACVFSEKVIGPSL